MKSGNQAATLKENAMNAKGLHIERLTRRNRLTGEIRVIGFELWTCDPWGDDSARAVCVGEGVTLREARAGADAARVVRPWVFAD